MLNLKNIVAEYINAEPPDYIFWKAHDDRARGLIYTFEDSNYLHIVLDRLKLLIKVILYFLLQIHYGLKKSVFPYYAFDPSANVKKNGLYRKYYIEHYFNQKIDFVHHLMPTHYCNLSNTAKAVLLYFRFFIYSIMSFLDFNRESLSWLAELFVNISKLKMIDGCTKSIYVFQSVYPVPYWLITYIHKRTSIKPIMVMSNTPLKLRARYCHLNVDNVACTRIQLYETQYYNSIGQNRIERVFYYPNEFIMDFQKIRPSKPTYDIGFFSSGEWARAEGLYRTQDITGIRHGLYCSNIFYKKAEEILEFLVDYVKCKGIVLKIYLHPYERELKNKYKIFPPFFPLVDNKYVLLDEAGDNSREKIYECFSMVALHSTIVWERIDLGLASTFFYEFENQDMNIHDPNCLGDLKRCVFRNNSELQSCLENDLFWLKGQPDKCHMMFDNTDLTVISPFQENTGIEDVMQL